MESLNTLRWSLVGHVSNFVLGMWIGTSHRIHILRQQKESLESTLMEKGKGSAVRLWILLLEHNILDRLSEFLSTLPNWHLTATKTPFRLFGAKILLPRAASVPNSPASRGTNKNRPLAAKAWTFNPLAPAKTRPFKMQWLPYEQNDLSSDRHGNSISLWVEGLKGWAGQLLDFELFIWRLE